MKYFKMKSRGGPVSQHIQKVNLTDKTGIQILRKNVGFIELG
jgi:hypothetical protein